MVVVVGRPDETLDSVGHLEVSEGCLNRCLDGCRVGMLIGRCLVCPLGGRGQVRTIHFGRGDDKDFDNENNDKKQCTRTRRAEAISGS